jgi:hypothetical protein
VQPSRRQVLAGVTVALAGACTSNHRPPAAPNPDVALTAAAIAREQALVTAYEAALLAHPRLRAELAPYRDDHAAHLQALRPLPSPSPALPVTGPSPLPEPTAVLARQRAALAALERAAATAHATATATASPQLATLLASLAASEASHAALL